jgi:hypothetical protein
VPEITLNVEIVLLFKIYVMSICVLYAYYVSISTLGLIRNVWVFCFHLIAKCPRKLINLFFTHLTLLLVLSDSTFIFGCNLFVIPFHT